MATLVAEMQIGSGVIRVLQGDLTLADTDAIVNAANSWLQHGGGVAAAIVRRGGPTVQEESDAAGFVPEGQVAVTGAGELSAKYVIHAVGPRGGDPEGDEKLQMAATNALLAAQELGLTSISFPAISSGIFGFPKDRCARILVSSASQYLKGHPEGPLRQVDFVLFDEETRDHFARALRAASASAP
ncbi:MAG: macro domain-containing protein [Bacteroidota bacterium]